MQHGSARRVQEADPQQTSAPSREHEWDLLLPLRTFAYPTHRGTVKPEKVQPAKAARAAKNAQIFSPHPMAHTSEQRCDGPPLKVKKGYAEADFMSNSQQARFGARPDYWRVVGKPEVELAPEISLGQRTAGSPVFFVRPSSNFPVDNFPAPANRSSDLQNAVAARLFVSPASLPK